MLALLPLALALGPAGPPPASPVTAPGRPSNYLTPAAAPAPAEPPPPATGIRRRSPYLLLAPAGVAFDYAFYVALGVSAGVMLPFHTRGLATVGGFFDAVTHLRWGGALINFGTDLRIGRADSRVFGYGLFRLGGQVTAFGGEYHSASILTTLGGGLLGLVGRRFLLGFEVAGDGTWFVDFASSVQALDPPPVYGEVQGRLLLGVKF